MNSRGGRPPARFLLAVIDAGGTVPPALSLGAELVGRGHQVRALGDPTIEPSARAAGCAFSPWREAPHFNSVAEQTAMIDALVVGRPHQAFRAAKIYAGKAMTSRFARDVVSTVRESPVDAILADGLPGILIGAHATRRPTAALVAQTFVRPTPGLPLLGTGWSPGQGFLGKVSDKIGPRVAARLLTPTLPRLNAVVERYELLPLDTSPVRLGDDEELVDAQILPSGPSFDNDNNLKLFASMIHNARHRISVTSPYYVPDETIQMALVTAGSRGLDVELFVSEIGDQFMVFHAQRSYYEQLLRAGVKIYLYRAPTILHAKHLSIDDDVALIGSSNLDIRSLSLHMELSVLVHGAKFTSAMRAVEDDYRSKSRQVLLEDWLKRPRPERVFDNLMRLTSSLQ